MEVTRFIGKYAEAEDAHHYIDVASFDATISNIRREIEKLEEVKSGIDSSSNNLKKENLSFFGKDLEEDINGMKDEVQNNMNVLNDYVEALSCEVSNALAKKQLELNEIAEEKERQEELMHETQLKQEENSLKGEMVNE